ncbi:Pyruvate kinase family protein [Raphanus sativus]|uniref:Pyruvate kinase n=1 Tax=Raphanus sativus TaxID=3726 RepID=A0A6J0P4U5_RAPSA|nr:pyruvate kinase, cytosolic isozyme-like [Raphanus sativus]KAJ4898547.1 Pyruvate kinase family protein [Raphanus sativus]
MEKILDGRTNAALKKTKIVCTLGPESRSVEMIEKLLKAGMNVARFNFSHGTHEYHQGTLDNLRIAMKNTGILCAVMLDTKGPEIRTGFLKEGKVQLTQGQEITISTDYTLKGDSNTISMSYKKLAEDLKPEGVILCSDGTISLTVLSCDKANGLVRCQCGNSATLGEKKNVNLPGVVVDLPTLTEKDQEDILKWGVPNKIDIIALSFVRKGSDLDLVRELLGEEAKRIVLMSKVENQEGVRNFDEILKKSDAFMVARGDLGMEIPIERIFQAQKMMISRANAVGKPVVTATQMLESMTKSPLPTRAEATDVANAVLDGTDCVMLSGETAAGDHPEAAVKIMARICKVAEDTIDYEAVHKRIQEAVPLPLSPVEDLAASAVSKAKIHNAKAIVVLTKGGYTAALVAKYRPSVPILSVAVADDDCEEPRCSVSVAKRGLIYRGIVPVVATGESTEERTRFAMELAKEKGICKSGDSVVLLHYTDGSSLLTILHVE